MDRIDRRLLCHIVALFLSLMILPTLTHVFNTINQKYESRHFEKISS